MAGINFDMYELVNETFAQHIKDYHNQPAAFITSVVFKDKLFAVTSAGIYRLNEDTNTFERVEFVNG